MDVTNGKCAYCDEPAVRVTEDTKTGFRRETCADHAQRAMDDAVAARAAHPNSTTRTPPRDGTPGDPPR